MSRVISRVLLGFAVVVCAAGASAQTTTHGKETKSFEVISVEGNKLVVKLPEGTKELTVPDDFRFNVDGRDLALSELKPGMKGTATVTTTTTVTPVTVTEVKNGTVMQRSGNSIIVKTDQGIKMFSEGDIEKRGVKILRDGKPATLADFSTGDKLSATIVTSHPPKVMTERQVQATLAKEAAPAPAAKPAPAAATPPVHSTPAPVATAGTPAPAHELPKTASPLPLVGMSGLLFLLAAVILRAKRRRLSN